MTKIIIKQGCDDCPFSHWHATRFYCEHPKGRNRDAVPEKRVAPDWCPLRKSKATIQLEGNE